MSEKPVSTLISWKFTLILHYIHKFISINLVTVKLSVKIWIRWSYFGDTDLLHVNFVQIFLLWNVCKNYFNRATPNSDWQPICCWKEKWFVIDFVNEADKCRYYLAQTCSYLSYYIKWDGNYATIVFFNVVLLVLGINFLLLSKKKYLRKWRDYRKPH